MRHSENLYHTTPATTASYGTSGKEGIITAGDEVCSSNLSKEAQNSYDVTV